MKKSTFTYAVSIRNSFSLQFKVFGVILVLFLTSAKSLGQTNNYFGTGNSLAGSVWSTNPAGPFTSALVTTNGAIANFNTQNLTLTGAAGLVFKEINATANTVFTGTVGTIQCYNSGILTVTVSNGILLDITAQGFMNQATNGYIKNGLGVFALGGNAANGGGVTINAGTLVVKGTNALGGVNTTNVLTLNGGTIAADVNRDLSTKLLRVDIRGDFTFGSSTLPATTASNLTFGVPVSLGTANRTITIGGTGTYTLGGVVSGSAGVGLTINNTAAGSLVLNGANTYDGTTTINGGTLKIGNAAALGSVSGGTIVTTIDNTTGGILDLNGTNYSSLEPLTIAGNGSGGGVLINTSVTGATFSGPITLNGSTVVVGGAGSLTLNNTSPLSGTGNLTLGGGVGGTITSPISITGNIIKAGTGSWTISGANSYVGTTNANAGTLKLGASGVIPDASAVSVTATLDLNSFSETVGSLTGAGSITSSAAGTPVLTTGGDNTNTNFSGIIQNGSATTVSLTKTGTGLQTISGANTYTGSTTITGGTLIIGAVGVIADASPVNLNGGSLSTGATAGFSETVGTLALTDNSTIALGTGVHSLTFADSHSISWTSGKTITITGWTGTAAASGTAGKVFVGIDATGLSVDQLAQISFAGYTGAMILSTGEVVPASGNAVAPPTLIASTGQTVDNPVNITFTDGDGSWRTAITAVKIGGTALTLTTDYTVSAGTITLKPAGLNSLLTNSTSAVKAVTVEATGYTVASVSQTIATGIANKLGMKTQPIAPATNGGTLLTQPAVYILDQYGNKTTSTATITASIGSGSWTLGGTVAVAAIAGTTTFSGLTAASDASVSGATITFSSGTLTSITSATFNISAPLITLTPASGVTVDAPFDVTFTENAFWRGSITGITVGGTTLDPSAYNKTVAGKITITPSASTLLQSAGTKTIVISSTGYTDASVSQIIGVGVATKLGVIQQPIPNASNNVALSTQPKIAIQDQYGNTVTSSTAAVTSTIASNGVTNWYLYGGDKSNKAAVAGVVSPTNLRPASETALTGVALTFTSTGLASITSNTFNLPDPVATPITDFTAATGATVDAPIVLTFTNNTTWFSNIMSGTTGVRINGTGITPTTDFDLVAGTLTLKPAGGNTLLRTPGNKTISISSNGYAATTVSQTINAGVPTSNSTATIGSALTAGVSRTITCTAKDQYNNLVSGYTFKYDATITNTDNTTAESYTIDGTAHTTTTNDISVTSTTNSSGVATFTATLPAAIDGGDGVSIQVQLSDGSTNIGSAFSYVNQTYNLTGTKNSIDLPFNGTSDVTVSSGELIVNSNANVSSITVAPGAKLTLNTGKILNVVGAFTLQSSPSGTATFVDQTTNGGLTVNGTTTVQQYLKNSRNWYVSSPVSAALSSVVDPVNTSNLLYWYDETKGAPAGWTPITSNATSLTPGLGYVVHPAADGVTLNYTGGHLNTGTTPSFSVNRTSEAPDHAGFNLIGNPYPSYLNAVTVVNSSSNLDKSIWYRTQKNTTTTYYFDTYNTLGKQGTNNSTNVAHISGTVAPLQAFWVHVSNGQSSASINFDNSYRTHANADTLNPLKVKNQVAQASLHLQVSNGVNSDETLIYSDPNASNGYDMYDSQKMSNVSASIPELYTLAGTELLAINGMNTIPYDFEIALGFSTLASGDFSIKASQFSNFTSGTQIILKDNMLNAQQDLTVADYLFTSDATTNNTSRFTLIFHAPSVSTGINTQNNDNVWISTRNGQLVVNGISKGATLEVFNALGQKVISRNLTGTNAQLNNNLVTGAYLVKLTNEGKSITKKIIID